MIVDRIGVVPLPPSDQRGVGPAVSAHSRANRIWLGKELAMIDVVTKDNAHLYGEALEEMFRLRHDVYVKERNWTDLARPDGLERDQFDNENATYLIAFDDGRVSGSVRLLPTVTPHLLGDLFPQLCEAQPVPRSEDIMEITRLCAHADYRQPGKKSFVIDRLATGMFEHAMG